MSKYGALVEWQWQSTPKYPVWNLSATLPNTHSTLTGLRLNPGLNMETLVTNYLTHSMATFLRTSLVTCLTCNIKQHIPYFKSTKHWLYIYSKTFNIRLVRSFCTGWIFCGHVYSHFQNFTTQNHNPIHCNTAYIKLYDTCNKFTKTMIWYIC